MFTDPTVSLGVSEEEVLVAQKAWSDAIKTHFQDLS